MSEGSVSRSMIGKPRRYRTAHEWAIYLSWNWVGRNSREQQEDVEILMDWDNPRLIPCRREPTDGSIWGSFMREIEIHTTCFAI